MKAGGGLTVERMVQLGRVSRASFYRFERTRIRGAMRHGFARCDPTDCFGVAQLRTAENHRGIAAARMDGESGNACTAFCGKTICCACGNGSSS